MRLKSQAAQSRNLTLFNPLFSRPKTLSKSLSSRLLFGNIHFIISKTDFFSFKIGINLRYSHVNKALSRVAVVYFT